MPHVQHLQVGDDLYLRPDHVATSFVAVTMRNPCSMYVSLAHFQGHNELHTKPWRASMFGQYSPSTADEPCPDSAREVDSRMCTRRHSRNAFLSKTGSMQAYILAAARSREHVGWYSYYIWSALVAPECHHDRFKEDDNQLGNHTARYEACYGNPRRIERDLQQYNADTAAHCWIFQEHAVENLRACLQAFEHAVPANKRTASGSSRYLLLLLLLLAHSRFLSLCLSYSLS